MILSCRTHPPARSGRDRAETGRLQPGGRRRGWRGRHRAGLRPCSRWSNVLRSRSPPWRMPWVGRDFPRRLQEIVIGDTGWIVDSRTARHGRSGLSKPLHRSDGVKPPAYPAIVSHGSANCQNFRSTPQKQPMAKVAALIPGCWLPATIMDEMPPQWESRCGPAEPHPHGSSGLRAGRRGT